MTQTATCLVYLADLWDDKVARELDEPELLRYRSNLLGADLRITNFGGGNTSSKIVQRDPLNGSEQNVLWVKGSGGDLGSIKRSGFATLYLEKLFALEKIYKGGDFEDEMVELYPLCTFGLNPVAASIDTPLHGFLPFNHVDHLHPDWGIALAASANGREKLAEFNARFRHRVIWIPWQRPGFELAMMLKKAVEDNPSCHGVVLGGHGLFTWGETQRECYLNTITIFDQLGQFVLEHVAKRRGTMIPGVGQFSFGKNKAESRITGEFYVNAIHVMEGAAGLGGTSECPAVLPQAGAAARTEMFRVHDNYVALPTREAFRIEYWALEEAKLRRQPPEKELSRQIAIVVGGGSGIGREAVRIAAERGAHVVVADRAVEAAEHVANEVRAIAGKEGAISAGIDICNRESIRSAVDKVIQTFGGVDIVINTAALFPSSPTGVISDELWGTTLEVNVTANYFLIDELAGILADQNLDASVVLTSSANAVVPKRGSEAYDVSKAALSHLVREFAISLSPKVRVNGVSPATVIKGSTMFPRDRVIASLKKYGMPFEESMTDEELRGGLAEFYAQRTLTHKPIDPADCARAILFLAGPQARCTSGHLIPVDGGLTEAFLR